MAVNLSPIGNGFQFFTTTGIPLAGGKLYTYQAGSSTPLATYTDNGGVYANTNPIILGSDGRPSNEIWLTYGYNYKFVLKDADDVTIQTYDNLYGIIGTQPSTLEVVPAGLISLWYGATGAVPSGWYLCDGTNGTPDLRDRFVVGAGNTYAVGATGGTADAIVVEHSHTYTPSGTISSASLTGQFPTASGNSTTYEGIASRGTSFSGNGGDPQTNYRVLLNATHDHTFTGSSGSVSTSGVSGTNQNLPPYYALAYIMKS